MQPHFFQHLLRQIRTDIATPPVASLLIGYAVSKPGSFNDSSLAAAALAIICLIFFANLQNDSADIDQDNAGNRDAPLNKGNIDFDTVVIWYRLFLAAGIAFVFATRDITSMFLFAVFTVLIWQYNRPPVQSSHKPVLSIVFLCLVFSTIPFFIGFALSDNSVSTTAVILAAGLLLHRISVSILKDYKDYNEDLRFNKRTFLIRYDARLTRHTSIVASLIGYVMIIAIGIRFATSPLAFLAILAAVILAGNGFLQRLQLRDKKINYKKNSLIFQRLFKQSIYFELSILLCLIMS